MQRSDFDNEDNKPLLLEADNSAAERMKYRLTTEQLLSVATPGLQNHALAHWHQDRFFAQGNDDIRYGLAQLIGDKNRGHYFNGQLLDNVDPETPRWEGHERKRLNFLFKEQTDHVVLAYSQGAALFIPTILMGAYRPGIDALLNQPQTQDRNVNVYLNEEDNQIYQDILMDEFPIGDPNNGTSKIIGYLPGPVHARFKLEQRNDQWGYALQYIESENQDIINIICDRPPSNSTIKKRYCRHPEFADARHKLKELISDKNDYDPALKAQAIKVLQAAEEALYSKKAPEKAIAAALRSTTELIKNPSIENAGQYQKLASSVSTRPWGKVLAASMLVLAGITLVAASTAIALVSFGALAPVSILGFTLAASTLVGGIAVGAGTLGIVTTVTGAALFAKDIKKPRTKLADEMTSLAKQAKSRT